MLSINRNQVSGEKPVLNEIFRQRFPFKFGHEYDCIAQCHNRSHSCSISHSCSAFVDKMNSQIEKHGVSTQLNEVVIIAGVTVNVYSLKN